jgi:class 3 adenylate cyclase/tetratricopeptide (TPR) repeat protein
MLLSLARYLSQDRRDALAQGLELAERSSGAALFADIAGFTELGEQLSGEAGVRGGSEALAARVDAVYEALNAHVERFDGSVVNFAGDALGCWFDDSRGAGAQRAFACAHAMQQAMRGFDGMALKVSVACGPARRMVVGDPAIQRLEAVGGAVVERLGSAERVAHPGDVLVDRATVESLGSALIVREWREGAGQAFAVVEPAANVAWPLPAPAAAPLPSLDADILRPWVLPAVYEREQAGHGTYLAELRQVVALFVRLGGIDYDTDPHAGAKLDQAVRCVQRIAELRGGVVLQLTLGDKGGYAYVAFGAPWAHEDDALRAVRAARELVPALRELGFLQPTSIGLSGGPTRTGAYGARSRATYGALGDDTNLAARLMAVAAPGEILVSDALRRSLAPDYVLRGLDPVRVKGRAEPVAVHAVTGERRSSAARRQERRHGTAMVGRQRELALAEEALRAALDGSQAQVITLTGDAGIGKSRLLAELLQAARRRGFRVVAGSCEATGRHSPYLAWRPVWRTLLGAGDSGDLSTVQDTVRSLVHTRVAAMPVLGPLLGMSIEESEFTRSLSPQERANVLTAVLEEALAALAVREPLLIAIEDTHWIDPASLELLETLVRGAPQLKLAFVLAHRPSEQDGDAPARAEALPACTRIVLRPLEPSEVSQLVAVRLAAWQPDCAETLEEAVAARLNAQAEGNPFYIEELLNHLRDRHVTLHEWAEDAKRQAELPPSLESLILARIDRLSEPQRATLKTASVIGRQFRVDWLHGCYPALGALPEVKAELQELERLDITPQYAPEPELAYLFKHVITREVTYESLPQATRVQLHGQFARYIETLDTRQHLDLLVHHYVLSDDLAKQREYLRRAAESAQAEYANEIALAYWERLLGLMQDEPDRAHIELQMGELLTILGRHDEAKIRLQAVLNFAQRAGERRLEAQAAQGMGKTLARGGQHEEANGWIDRALAIWQSLGARREEGRAMLAKAEASSYQVWSHKRDWAEKALAIAKGCGDTATELLATTCLGLALRTLGDGRRGHALLEEAAAAVRRFGDRHVWATFSVELAGVYSAQGKFAEAVALLEEVLSFARETGDRNLTYRALRLLAVSDRRVGNQGSARARLEAAMQLAKATGATDLQASILHSMTIVARVQSDLTSAREYGEALIELARRSRDLRMEQRALVGMGCTALYGGQLDHAQEALERARSMVDAHGSMTHATVLDNLGLVALARGDLAAANIHVRAALAMRADSSNLEVQVFSLTSMVALLARCERMKEAATVAAAVGHACEASGFKLDAYTTSLVHSAVASARQSLPGAEFDAAWSAGLAMTLDDAIALALQS